jgi:hypothetical protein
MPGFEIGEELPDRSCLAFSGIYQALANTFLRGCLRGYIEQALIGLGILHDGSSLSLDREYDGPLALLELLYKGPGLPAEGG